MTTGQMSCYRTGQIMNSQHGERRHVDTFIGQSRIDFHLDRTKGLDMRIRWAAALAAVLLIIAPGRGLAQRNLAVAPPAPVEQRVALVIGNSSYKETPLKNPVNDATDMAAALKDLGFKVTLKTDANQRQMKQALREFAQDIRRGGVGLFYFAGHGVQSRGRNFLLPVGASIESEAEVEDETIDANLVLSYMEEAQNRVNIVVLDACRNNPFARSFRSASRGLAQMDAAKGSFVAFATAPGSVSADGTGRNGIYTEHLLKSLKQPDGDIDKVFRRVAAEVSTVTAGKQVPWVASSMTGDFYFRAPTKPVVDDTRLKQSEKERADLAKALEDERKQRNKDTELVRAEMEKLRAELQKIRVDAAAAPAPAPIAAAPATKPAFRPQPDRPVQGATATPQQVPVPAPPAGVAAASPVAPYAASARPPQQVAIASPRQGRRSDSRAAAAEWRDSVALLEKFRGQLTYSKAMALLLGVKADEAIELLVRHDAQLRGVPYSSAFALGVNADGLLQPSVAGRQRSPMHATNTVLENCNRRNTAGSCRVVMANGKFQEKEFMEVAAKLGGKPRDMVRQGAFRWIAKSIGQGASQ